MTYKGYTLRPCVLARGVSRISCWEIVRADGSRFELADRRAARCAKLIRP